MKIRNGFVSNSSSSSFVIGKAEITEEQWNELKKFVSTMNANSYNDTYLHKATKYIHGTLDHCDSQTLYDKLKELGIPEDAYDDTE